MRLAFFTIAALSLSLSFVIAAPLKNTATYPNSGLGSAVENVREPEPEHPSEALSPAPYIPEHDPTESSEEESLNATCGRHPCLVDQ